MVLQAVKPVFVMRILKQSESLKIRLLGGLLAASALALATPAWSATTSPAPPGSPATPYYSPGVADILKMVNAKVDAEVIKAYIRNSSYAYNPSAAEIIAFKQQGLPDEVITAMVQRGGELRAQATYAQLAAGTPPYPATTSPYAPQPSAGYDYGATYPDYSYDYGYPYDYYPPYYPSYYGYGYGYPWWDFGFYWPFYFGFSAFHHFGDHDHFGRFHDSGRFGRGRVGGFSGRNPGLRNFNQAGRTSFAPSHSFGAPHSAFGASRSGFAGSSSAFAARGGGFRSGGGFGGGHAGGFSGGHGGGFGGGHGGGGHGGGGHGR